MKLLENKKVHYQDINVGLFYWDTAWNAALIVNIISNESCRKRVKCFVHLWLDYDKKKKKTFAVHISVVRDSNLRDTRSIF